MSSPYGIIAGTVDVENAILAEKQRNASIISRLNSFRSSSDFNNFNLVLDAIQGRIKTSIIIMVVYISSISSEC